MAKKRKGSRRKRGMVFIPYDYEAAHHSAIPARNMRHAMSRPERVQSATSTRTEQRHTRPTSSGIRRSRTESTKKPQRNSVNRQTRSG